MDSRNPRPATPWDYARLVLCIAAGAALLWFAPGWLDRAFAQPADLSRVNDSVNRSIAYQSDRDQYGVEDWPMANPVSGRGDCEDYALTKQAILGRGEVVIVRYREAVHAVLIVDGWVLDNIEGRVVSVETARRYYAF